MREPTAYILPSDDYLSGYDGCQRRHAHGAFDELSSQNGAKETRNILFRQTLDRLIPKNA